jgi:hypothetical protein
MPLPEHREQSICFNPKKLRYSHAVTAEVTRRMAPLFRPVSASLRSSRPSVPATVKEIMFGLANIEFPSQRIQPLGEIPRFIKDFIDLEFPTVVEPATKHSRLLLRQPVIDRSGRGVTPRIHKEHPTAWRQTTANQSPELFESLGWNVRKPKAKKYRIEFPTRLPLEQVRFNVSNCG